MENIKKKWRLAARKSLMFNLNSRQTICETLRLIYDEIHDMKNNKFKKKLTELLTESMYIAKKMQDRLMYYKRTYKDNTGAKGKSIKRLLGNIERRKMRKARYETI